MKGLGSSLILAGTRSDRGCPAVACGTPSALAHCDGPWHGDRISYTSPPGASFELPKGPPGYEAFFEEVVLKRKGRNLEAFADAAARARQRRIPVVVGITPTLGQQQLRPLPREVKLLLNELDARGVTVFDVRTVMAKAVEDPTPLFLDPVHFSAQGHAVVGEALGGLLEELVASEKALTARPRIIDGTR